MVGKEGVELDALLEILYCLCAPDLLQEIKVTINVNASSNKSVPMHALQFDISVVFLKLEVNSLIEVNVWSLDCVHIVTKHFKLVEIEVFGEHLHFNIYYNN